MTAREISARIVNGLTIANYWLIARGVLGLLAILEKLPADRALNFADWIARKVGPLSGRHRVAVANLRKAFPDKSDAEIEEIASDMWGNMARLVAEYVFIEKLFDYDPKATAPGRIEVVGEERFIEVRGDPRPHIFFTAHLGNFELLPIAASSFDLDVTALFRAPNNPYLAGRLARRRKKAMGSLLASRTGVAFTLARILDGGGNVGMLVDQRFMNGVPTTFFGQRCESSPLLPRLARQFDCDIYPARCIRLPGNRFRLEILEKIALPRTPKGRVDVDAAAQMLNDIVEGWIRETPGQWMWFHKRWKITKKPPRKVRLGVVADQRP